MCEHRKPLSRMRLIIGDNLRESVSLIPHSSNSSVVNCDNLVAFSQKLKSEGHKISMTVIFAKAISKALEEFPSLNARLEGKDVIEYDCHNAGVAIELPTGLAVIVLKNIQDKNLFEIDADFHVLLDKIKSNTLTLDDITGSTFTSTVLSMRRRQGVFTSIINNHEGFILAMGPIFKNPVVDENDNIVVQNQATCVLNYNHALFDGVITANFADRVYDILEDPEAYLV